MPSSGHQGHPDLRLVSAPVEGAHGGVASAWAADLSDVGPDEPWSNPSSALAAVHYDDGAVWVVELFGEADLSTRPTLECALTRGLSKGRGAFVLDVSNLTFCDSTCVTAVLEANVDGCLVLAGARGTVARVFDILDPQQSIARYRTPRPPFPR